ncbi:50S ribosomal protein L37ae [Candidatus Woesearchaeota archaeon]|nr:50S ribosomal protein L37ae [Candidatus Woesearchaeota archaeon]
MATKKVGSAGKFGARYGKRLRVKYANIDKAQRIKHKCPSCTQNKVTRVAIGIWQCKKCGVKFAGKAYKLEE